MASGAPPAPHLLLRGHQLHGLLAHRASGALGGGERMEVHGPRSAQQGLSVAPNSVHGELRVHAH